MTRSEFVRLLEDLLKEPAGALAMDRPLAQVDAWDSLAVVGFMALVDEQFGEVVSPRAVQQATTVGDLVALVEQRGLLDSTKS